jgi:hypothetical protein
MNGAILSQEVTFICRVLSQYVINWILAQFSELVDESELFASPAANFNSPSSLSSNELLPMHHLNLPSSLKLCSAVWNRKLLLSHSNAAQENSSDQIKQAKLKCLTRTMEKI